MFSQKGARLGSLGSGGARVAAVDESQSVEGSALGVTAGGAYGGVDSVWIVIGCRGGEVGFEECHGLGGVAGVDDAHGGGRGEFGPVTSLLHPIQIIPQKIIIRRPPHQIPMRCHRTVVQHRIPCHGPFFQTLLQIRHEELVEMRILVQKRQGKFASESTGKDAMGVGKMLQSHGGSDFGLHLHPTFVGPPGRGGISSAVDLDSVSPLGGGAFHNVGSGSRRISLFGEAGCHLGHECLVAGIDNVEAELKPQQCRVIISGIAGGAIDELYDDLSHGIGIPQ
mmetsp:Transcript_9882/g.17773  ORF Transcript_9882/g.17773 Transcript_9882/m.17773 type:complete len:281 (+) Transcript_9882:1803-2645(+)